VNAELLVPADFEERFGSKIIVVRAVLFLLRLAVNPAITLPVFSNYAFSNLAQVSDDEAHFFPYEVYPRHFPLGVTGGITTQDALEWLASHWQVAVRLFDQSAEFLVAAEAIDSGQFVRESRLTLVSIWGALEALFSPSTSELKFRVSALIAAYLEPPGSGRHGLQRQVAKMYDKRSAAAHGKPKHDPDDLLAAFNLLKRVLLKIVGEGVVPSKELLEASLFGA